MNTWIILGICLLIVIEGFVLWSDARHKRQLKNPNSPESLAASKLISGLSAESRQALTSEVESGQYLNAIKQLRAFVPGTGLQQAKDAIDYLKRGHGCA